MKKQLHPFRLVGKPLFKYAARPTEDGAYPSDPTLKTITVTHTCLLADYFKKQ